MNDEVIIPVELEAHDENIKQTLDKIRSYMEKLQDRRAELIDNKKLAVTEGEIKSIEKDLRIVNAFISEMKTNYGKINEYLRATQDVEKVSYGKAQEESLKRQEELRAQILESQKKLAEQEKVVSQATRTSEDAIRKELKSRQSELKQSEKAEATARRELNKSNADLAKNERAVEDSLQRQEKLSSQLSGLTDKRSRSERETRNNINAQLNEEKQRYDALLAEQHVIKNNIAIQQDAINKEITAREQLKQSIREQNSAALNTDEVKAARDKANAIRTQLSAQQEQLATEEKISNTISQEIAEGKNLDDTYKTIARSAEAQAVAEGRYLSQFQSVTAEASKLVEMYKQVESGEATRRALPKSYEAEINGVKELLQEVNTYRDSLNQRKIELFDARKLATSQSDLEVIDTMINQIESDESALLEVSQEFAAYLTVVERNFRFISEDSKEMSGAIFKNVKDYQDFAQETMQLASRTKELLDIAKNDTAARKEEVAVISQIKDRYSGVLGVIRRLYDVSKERVEMEKQANAELEKTGRVSNNVTSAWYKMTRSVKMLEHEIYSMNQNINKLGTGFLKTGKNLGKMVLALSTGFLSLAASIKKTTQAHKGMNNEFKLGLTTILKYGFGIRSLFVLFNKLRGGIVDALKALALASDYVNQEISSLVTSLKFMEAAAATVVQPILKVLAPALEILSAAFEKAAYYASSFIATLTGQDFVFRAARSQVDFAKSLDKTGKAAKKARKELGYYDKLNVIHKDNKNGSGSGLDDKYAGFDYKKSPLLEDAKKLAQKIQKLVKDFFKPLRKAWRKDGEWVIDKWKGALFSIKDLIASIGSDFMEVWQEDETQKVFSNILKTLGHIGGFFDNLGDSIREAWEENDIGLRILEKLRDMLIDITGSIEKIAEGFEKWALDVDFTTLFQHFYDLLDSLEKGPLKTICALVEDFFNTVVFPFMTYMVEEGLPNLFDKIKEISDRIDWDKLRERMDKLFGAIEQFDEKLWDAFIIVLGDLGDAVADIVNSEAFGKLIDWVVDWIENTDAETMAKQIEQIAVALVALKLALKGFEGILAVTRTIGVFRTAFGNTGEALTQVTTVAETTAKAPWWSKIVAKIGDVAKSMSALGGEGAGAAAGGGVAGTVAGALAIVAGAFMNLFGVVKQADGEINILTVTLTALGTALGVIGAILLGAPALIATVVGAVILWVEECWVAIVNFLRNVATAPESFAESVNKTLQDIGSWIDNVKQWFDEIFTAVSDFFYNLGTNVGEGLGKIAGKIYRWFKNLPVKIGNWLSNFFSTTWPKVKATLKEFPKNLATWVSEVDWAQFGKDILNGILWVFMAPARFLEIVAQAITSFVGGFIDGFKKGFDINSPSKVMMPYGEYILQGILEGIIDAVTGIGSWIKTNIVDKFISGLKDGFKIVNGVAEGLFDIGKNVVEGFKKGVDGNLSKVADAGNNLVNAMKDKVEEKLDINSPSKVFEQIGLYVDEGLAEGIEEGTKKATDAMAKTTDAVSDTADSPFALDSIEKFADTFIDTLTSMSTEAISIISTMIDSIDDKMSNLKQVDSLNNTLTRVSKTKIPRIAQGFSIPASIQLQKKSKDEFDWDKLSDIIRDVLEDTVGVVSTNSNKDPVVLMLNGKQIAQAVWDENTKRYKQTGKEGYAY